ncbi:nucleotidyltransferase [Vallitalea okinawensis]|uniref:nucleotidyltransferase n=1 Tax=Vallitalea okinawensis TaxID=2078660 RepID=UPI000CFD9414|nr:nucleotidyltransferase [Vallitalea okinawensis]
MKIVGLITEYNPFHNGHLYHLNKSKEVTGATYSIAVMSGNFVQRGCPAYVNKWVRTRMALESGVDMVIEIPTYYSTASAELFAMGSISLLNATGIVDYVCFGSEAGEIDFINHVATILANESENYQKVLKKHLHSGDSFAVSRTKSLYQIMQLTYEMEYSFDDFKNLLSAPNNILGIEYIKWLKRLNSNIKAATIQRVSTGYHDQSVASDIASASGIREALNNNSLLEDIRHTMPDPTYRQLITAFEEGLCPITFDDYSTALHYAISLLGPDRMKDIFEISEGLENRIYKHSHSQFLISDLLKGLSTRRYTNARLNRVLLNTLLGITNERFNYFRSLGGPQYLKILGIRKESDLLFKMLKEKAKLPLITNMGRSIAKLPFPAQEMLKDEITFSDIYTLGYRNKKYVTKESEFKHPFIVV